MNSQTYLDEPSRVDEPSGAQYFSDVLTQVAMEGRPVIVQRDGKDLAAVIPIAFLQEVKEYLARLELEKKAAGIDWQRFNNLRPPQAWFDVDDNPFAPEAEREP